MEIRKASTVRLELNDLFHKMRCIEYELECDPSNRYMKDAEEQLKAAKSQQKQLEEELKAIRLAYREAKKRDAG